MLIQATCARRFLKPASLQAGDGHELFKELHRIEPQVRVLRSSGGQRHFGLMDAETTKRQVALTE
jgi:hypothetical protein